MDEGKSIEFDEKGNKVVECEYKNGKKEGKYF